MWTCPQPSMSSRQKSCFMAAINVSGRPSSILRLDLDEIVDISQEFKLLGLLSVEFEAITDVDVFPTGVTLLCPLILGTRDAGGTCRLGGMSSIGWFHSCTYFRAKCLG